MQRPAKIAFSTLPSGCPTQNLRRQLMSSLILMDPVLLNQGRLPRHAFFQAHEAAGKSILPKGQEYPDAVYAMLDIQQNPLFNEHFGTLAEPERNSIAWNIARYLAGAGEITTRYAAAA